MTTERVDPAAQLRLAFEMFEVGVAMMRQKLRRERPAASKEEIEELLERWLNREPRDATTSRSP